MKCAMIKVELLYNRGVGTAFKAERDFFKWLKECADKKVFVCSICNGAFALGHAGLLKDTECTTHWRRIEEMQAEFQTAKLITDIFFKRSNNVYTSATT